MPRTILAHVIYYVICLATN